MNPTPLDSTNPRQRLERRATLVREFVTAHDRSIEARSAGLGLGSEFLVRLPRLATGKPPPGAPC